MTTLTRSAARRKRWNSVSLEKRLMLAADAGVAVSSPAVEVSHQPTVSTQRAVSPSPSIVFIDSAVEDLSALQRGVDSSSEFILMDADQDPIYQISRVLAGRRDVPSLHLVGHGDEGQIKLAGTVIDSELLSERQSEIRSWQQSLGDDADLLIYGCNTGGGDAGLRFVSLLASLTGADIAASTDKTGNEALGGDWDLERHLGDIETAIVFDAFTQDRFRQVLPIQIRAAGSTGEEIAELQIDGQTVATFNNVGGDANNGVFETLSYNGNGVDPNLIRVVFTNDLYEPDQGIDRNLRVDSIIVDGVTYETEDPSVFSTGTWKPEDGITPGNRESEWLNGDGYFQYAGGSSGSTIVVTADGQDGRENFELRIDGNTVASYDSIGTARQNYTYFANETISPDRISVAFTNDVFDEAQGIDYNLNVDSISIDGTVYETESPSVFSTGTWLPEDGITPGFRQNETLHTNGTFQYASNIQPPVLPSIRINAGGGEYVDTSGNTWLADQYFDGGNVFSTTSDIFQTDDDALYQTERWSQSLGYDIPIENGAYEVDLHFAEIYFDDFGQRVFDVSIEGQLVEDDLDIYERTRNAFFPGKDNALIINTGQIVVGDGVLNLDMLASVNNAKLSAIEIRPVSGPGLLLQPTGGSTAVTENGAGDSYQVQLNEAPTANVSVALQTDGSQLSLSTQSLTFTPSNWQTPQSVFVSAVDDGAAEGVRIQQISHVTSSSDSRYNNRSSNLSVRINDNDVIPIDFDQRTIATVQDPTTAAWGPDGRLYVGSTNGTITALTLDNNSNVTETQVINTLSGLSNNNILGIAFNPFESTGQPRIYVSHSQLYANGGSSFPETEFSPYSGQVSVLEGANFGTAQTLISGLPVSNHDHGINGLAFDNAGDLYIAVGGNTNAGIINSALGGIPESPFSAAVLKADIRNANFNGQVEYELNSGFNPPPGLSFDAADSQTFGDQVSVVSGVDVRVYSSGLRNPYDLVFTTDGLLYGTDNGPNNGFGDVSTGPNSQQPVTGAPDELNLLSDGGYFGHPNRTRGVANNIENFYFGPNESSNGNYTAPLTTLPSSTNGIDEYRSQVFGGQLTGQLVTQKYNGQVIFVDRSADGLSVIDTQSYNNIADGLDLLVGSGGSVFGIDFAQDRITVATPVVSGVTSPTAYDISIWRGAATGGNPFTIGGANFGDLSNTTVTIGGVEVQLTSVFENRVNGILPNLSGSAGTFVDVVVTSAGISTTLQQAYLPLG